MKKILISAVLVGVFLVSGQALAQDNSALIAQLQAQIAALQEQVRVLQNQQRGGFCYNFNKDFGIGESSQSELKNLYDVLKKEGFDMGRLTIEDIGVFQDDMLILVFRQNYFNLVKKFQSKYGIPATGYVGPLTRAKLNSLYGCQNNSGDLVLSGTFGPTSLAVGETGIWKIFVRSQNNSSLNYQINWGDNVPVAHNLQPIAGATMSTPQESSFSHAYSQPGTYTISFTVSDGVGHQVQGTMSVVIRPQAGPGLQVLSPDGGENWVANSVQDIRWQTVGGAVPKVDLYLDRTPNIYCITTPCDNSFVLDRNIDMATIYHWIVATDISNNQIPAGTYSVRVCAAGSQTNCDSSDRSFAITPQYLPSSGSSTTHN